eukprot:1316846-Amorphochlora_amoeboformis.AAC.1
MTTRAATLTLLAALCPPFTLAYPKISPKVMGFRRIPGLRRAILNIPRRVGVYATDNLQEVSTKLAEDDTFDQLVYGCSYECVCESVG